MTNNKSMLLVGVGGQGAILTAKVLVAGLMKAGYLQPYEAIVVENAPLGIRAGVAAKIFTIAVNTGPLAVQTLLDANADLLFPTMTDFSESWPELMQSI